MARNRRGFTILEVLVAAALVALGVAGLVGGLGTLSQAQRRMIDRERIERLADAKLEELAATQTYTSETEGTFDLEGEPDYSWEVIEETTGVENVYELRLTVTRSGKDDSLTVQKLVFTPPASTEEGA